MDAAVQAEDHFPKQSEDVTKSVVVSLNGRTRQYNGVLIRDDVEAPFVTIVHLLDGRTMLGTECVFRVTDSALASDEIIFANPVPR